MKHCLALLIIGLAVNTLPQCTGEQINIAIYNYIFFCTASSKLVTPVSYIIPLGSSDVTVNGSSANCTMSCTTPTSSVLFDGNIPTLTGLENDTWASQLLTIQTETFVPISFTFDNGTSGMGRVEIVLFNCPEWEIAVMAIGIGSMTINPTITSCKSLVRVCIPYFICNDSPVIIRFITNGVGMWLHIAEVMFHHGFDNNSITCPPDTIIPTPSGATDPPFTTDASPTEG